MIHVVDAPVHLLIDSTLNQRGEGFRIMAIAIDVDRNRATGIAKDCASVFFKQAASRRAVRWRNVRNGFSGRDVGGDAAPDFQSTGIAPTIPNRIAIVSRTHFELKPAVFPASPSGGEANMASRLIDATSVRLHQNVAAKHSRFVDDALAVP